MFAKSPNFSLVMIHPQILASPISQSLQAFSVPFLLGYQYLSMLFCSILVGPQVLSLCILAGLAINAPSNFVQPSISLGGSSPISVLRAMFALLASVIAKRAGRWYYLSSLTFRDYLSFSCDG